MIVASRVYLSVFFKHEKILDNIFPTWDEYAKIFLKLARYSSNISPTELKQNEYYNYATIRIPLSVASYNDVPTCINKWVTELTYHSRC